MTEDEAKEKWCPFSRTMGMKGEVIMPAANRVFIYDGDNKLQFPHPEMCACIASKCMAWRWDGPQDFNRPGHCGLAGRP